MSAKEILSALLLSFVAISPGRSDDATRTSEYPYASETPQERRVRIDQAKQRVKDFIARAKARISDTPSTEQIDKERDQIQSERVLSDSELEPGDIVSTNRGLFIFRGQKDQDHTSNDFMPFRLNSKD